MKVPYLVISAEMNCLSGFIAKAIDAYFTDQCVYVSSGCF